MLKNGEYTYCKRSGEEEEIHRALNDIKSEIDEANDNKAAQDADDAARQEKQEARASLLGLDNVEFVMGMVPVDWPGSKKFFSHPDRSERAKWRTG